MCGCVCASFWGRTCRWPFRTKFSWASNFSGVVFSGGVAIDVVFGTGFQPVNPPASGPSGPGPSEGQGGAPGHKGPHAVACPPCGVPPMRSARISVHGSTVGPTKDHRMQRTHPRPGFRQCSCPPTSRLAGRHHVRQSACGGVSIDTQIEDSDLVDARSTVCGWRLACVCVYVRV